VAKPKKTSGDRPRVGRTSGRPRRAERSKLQPDVKSLWRYLRGIDTATVSFAVIFMPGAWCCKSRELLQIA
jgi:hypothetical protein